MIIHDAKFIMGNTDYRKCPKPDKAEFAFIGRSNVGKSSLINMMTGRNKLAKVSGTPGKTRELNHFGINDEWYLVDLPGYGYAKVSKKARHQFEENIQQYLTNRQNLICLFVLVDSRLPPQKIDQEFMEWCGEKGIPFMMVFTKGDKNSSGKLSKLIKAYNDEMLTRWESLPKQYITSSESKLGRDGLLKDIQQMVNDWNDSI